jgi:hypothetical protein
MFKRKQPIQEPQGQPIENLIKREPEVKEVQEVKEKEVTPAALIISTELTSEGTYRNIIISNVLLGNVGDKLDWE